MNMMKSKFLLLLLTVSMLSVSMLLSSCSGISKVNMGKEETSSTQETESKTADGWQEEDGSKYYYKNNTKQTGWLQLGDQWYYLGNDGKMRTGWIVDDNDKWRYMNEDGTMATNTTIDGRYINKYGEIQDSPAQAAQNNAASGNSGEGNSSSGVSYQNYKNGRYGFSIDYPTYFRVDMVPDNGDGVRLVSDDGAQISVSGINNVLNQTVSDCYNYSLSQINSSVSYQSCSGNKYVISYKESGFIYYHCSVVGTGSINSLTIRYPVDKKEYYDDIVTNIYNSFNTPGVGEYH